RRLSGRSDVSPRARHHRRAPRSVDVAANANHRYAARLLVLPASLSARPARAGRRTSSGRIAGRARAAADVRSDRLRCAAAAAGRARSLGPRVLVSPPPPPPPVLSRAPRPAFGLAPPPPPPPIFALVLPIPVYRPVPAYISPPAYVAPPPPNNIIYNNVHNTV